MKTLGARLISGQCVFTVWAPLVDQLGLSIHSPCPREYVLTRDSQGYFQKTVEGVAAGTKYFYKIDQDLFPDPASFYQPDDVLGASSVVDHDTFAWKDKHWKGIELKDMVLYELHVGTFSAEGTFEAACRHLKDLVDLGVTGVELMPVAQFPGDRNWGYDGVYPFAVQHSYGGPEGLKKFVDACHGHGLAVILDVVYNHLGPEGNFLPKFMPVFTDRYRGHWGDAINFDGAYSDGVRDFFIQNAIFWISEYHLDALRLDAVHGIFDMSARHFLRELAQKVEEIAFAQKRKVYLIAESDLNDRQIVLDFHKEGYGIHSQWNDDFHHAIHAVLTGENSGYYEDFGTIAQIGKAMKEGFVYNGIYSPFRKRRHGSLSNDLSSDKFVVCLQNHDQIGNRLKGERLSRLVPFDALKLAAGALLTSPYIPLIFMGEEYGEKAPFPYFVSFHDQELVQSVREGRIREFESFGWTEMPPDPFDVQTYIQAKLEWNLRRHGQHHVILMFHKKLLELRKTIPALSHLSRENMDVQIEGSALLVRRQWSGDSVLVLMNFAADAVVVKTDFKGEKILDSAEKSWMGSQPHPDHITPQIMFNLAPLGFVIYR